MHTNHQIYPLRCGGGPIKTTSMREAPILTPLMYRRVYHTTIPTSTAHLGPLPPAVTINDQSNTFTTVLPPIREQLSSDAQILIKNAHEIPKPSTGCSRTNEGLYFNDSPPSTATRDVRWSKFAGTGKERNAFPFKKDLSRSRFFSFFLFPRTGLSSLSYLSWD